MPRRDGTGPAGAGAMTGRGLGICAGNNAINLGTGVDAERGAGRGLACRRGLGRRSGRGFGRGPGVNRTSQGTQKEFLNKQKIILQKRLETIDRQLKSL
ncbi:MAG: DUF5320 domain-containing protein [Lachnospiraceae bacterium]|jgi:hypothetical protein